MNESCLFIVASPSGGGKSSLIAALACKVGHNVDTFNLGFRGDHGMSEHDVAADVAKRLGVRHRPLMIDPADVLGEMERSFAVYDEPFGDQAALPQAVFPIVEGSLGHGEGGGRHLPGPPLAPGQRVIQLRKAVED